MRLLLMSNSTLHGSGYLGYCAEEIINFLEKNKRVVFIPYALNDWDAYTETARAKFNEIGFELSGIHEYTDTTKALEEADCIFTGGGNTFRLLNELYNRKLIPIISEKVKNGSINYMGASAGTGITSPTIKTSNDMPIVYPPSFNALNLVPFSFNCHYFDADPKSTHKGETREMRLAEFHEMNTEAVLGLWEGAILRVENNKATLKGLTKARLFKIGQPQKEYFPGDDLSFLLK